MYCVGLTGNIASGKSTVAAFFKNKGVMVISADEIAREITAPHEPALTLIKDHFGHEVITTQGELNRSALRTIIFENPKERLWLEGLLHPLIRQRIIEEIAESPSPYSVIEIPLLKDREVYPYLNRILVILANREEQIRRVMNRDNCSREHAKAILAVQPEELSREKIADDIVINTGSLSELEEKIEKLHQMYLQLASQE